MTAAQLWQALTILCYPHSLVDKCIGDVLTEQPEQMRSSPYFLQYVLLAIKRNERSALPDLSSSNDFASNVGKLRSQMLRVISARRGEIFADDSEETGFFESDDETATTATSSLSHTTPLVDDDTDGDLFKLFPGTSD